MSLSMAMIALGPNARVSGAAIRAELARQWPDLPKAKAGEQKEGTFSFRVGSLDVIGGVMPFPVPWSDLEGPCATSILWEDAGEVLRTHAGHLILTVSGTDRALDRIRLLTQVTAAVLATCPAAVGVFWTHAALVIPPPLFLDFATRVLPLGPPLDIWVDFRVGKTKAGKTHGFTRGMDSLGFMEFETTESPESPVELRERFQSLANYLIEKGPVIRDGDTFGESATERIKIYFDDSSFGHEQKVMRLEYAPARGKRRRRRRRAEAAKPRLRVTAYGYIQAATTLIITIALGFLLHWLLAGVIPGAILRHVLLDIPLIVVGFVLFIVSDNILQKMFGLEALAPVPSADEDE